MAAVISILLYGSELWDTTKKQMKRFEVFHQRSLRRILKIKWFFHVSNEDVLKRANIRSIETFISAARLRWYGHVVRMPENRLQNVSLNCVQTMGRGREAGPARTGMPAYRRKLQSSPVNINSNGVQALATDRVQWRHTICRQRDVCDAGHSND